MVIPWLGCDCCSALVPSLQIVKTTSGVSIITRRYREGEGTIIVSDYLQIRTIMFKIFSYFVDLARRHRVTTQQFRNPLNHSYWWTCLCIHVCSWNFHGKHWLLCENGVVVLRIFSVEVSNFSPYCQACSDSVLISRVYLYFTQILDLDNEHKFSSNKMLFSITFKVFSTPSWSALV